MIIALSGVPATGKSTLAKKISKIYHIPIIVVSDLVISKKIKATYNKSLKTYDVDPKLVDAYIKANKIKHAIIESVFSQVLKSDLVIVCSCDLKTLANRLEGRKYSQKKIRDNLDAQIFDTCYMQAIELGKSPIKFDCTKPITAQQIKKQLDKKIND